MSLYDGQRQHYLSRQKQCPCCQLPIPTSHIREQGQSIPCSEYHVRCIRCLWPVAKTHISPVGTCVACMSGSDRRRYFRRVGTGEIKMTEGRAEKIFGKQNVSSTPQPKQVKVKQQILFRQFDEPATSNANGSAEKVWATYKRRTAAFNQEDTIVIGD